MNRQTLAQGEKKKGIHRNTDKEEKKGENKRMIGHP